MANLAVQQNLSIQKNAKLRLDIFAKGILPQPVVMHPVIKHGNCQTNSVLDEFSLLFRD